MASKAPQLYKKVTTMRHKYLQKYKIIHTGYTKRHTKLYTKTIYANNTKRDNITHRKIPRSVSFSYQGCVSIN